MRNILLVKQLKYIVTDIFCFKRRNCKFCGSGSVWKRIQVVSIPQFDRRAIGGVMATSS